MLRSLTYACVLTVLSWQSASAAPGSRPICRCVQAVASTAPAVPDDGTQTAGTFGWLYRVLAFLFG
jgi:hypothetical protein